MVILEKNNVRKKFPKKRKAKTGKAHRRILKMVDMARRGILKGGAPRSESKSV